LDSGKVRWAGTGVSCTTWAGQFTCGSLVLGGAKEGTSAIKYPFLVVGGVAAFAMVVTRLVASADGKP
jgi:hypothetical protein